MKSGKKIFRPRARIIKSLGDELISNEFVAISELIKNSHDAGASFAKIDIQNDRLIIADNGKGMTLEGLQEGWFEPATNIKIKNKKLLGEKGIGRFSVVKLASKLELRTKAENSNGIVSIFDWEEFNKENSYLDEVEVEWSEAEWVEETETGTLLILTGLKNNWQDEEQVKRLDTFLSRMISPFAEPQTFEILLKTQTDGGYKKIQTSEILKHPNYFVSGSVSGDKMLINYSGLQNRKKQIEKRMSAHLFPCGDFKFEFRVWDRDPQNIKEISEEYGQKPKEVKDTLDYAAGVSIYRDDFRVLPYGEPNNDWLRLDMRRVQNPTLRLSNNQVIGYIRISKEENPELKDKTNREGLIENPQLVDLYQKVLDGALKAVEEERYLDRAPKRDEITAKRNDSLNLETNVSLDEAEKYAKETYPDDKDLSGKLSKAKEENREQNQKFKKLILRYRRLSTLGQILETVIHQMNNSFAKVSAQLSTAINYAGDNQKVVQKINEVKDGQLLLQKFIDRLKPFAERNTDKAILVSIKEEIENIILIESALLDKYKISVTSPAADARLLIKKIDVFAIFSNLISNSVYWLNEVNPEEGKKIEINLTETEATVEISFSDNGPGVQEEYKPYIFDPYFSLKKDGTGLGLSIIGEIVAEYNGEFEYYDDGDLPGAAFKLTFKK